MRSPTATLRAAAALAAVLLSGCAQPHGLRVEGPAVSPTPQAGPVYVADAMGQPLQRPTSFGLTEFASVSELRWSSWGRATAEATGRVSGSWCLPECTRNPYPAKITLSGLLRQERVAYYTRATVVSESLPPEQAAELGRITLPLPEF